MQDSSKPELNLSHKTDTTSAIKKTLVVSRQIKQTYNLNFLFNKKRNIFTFKKNFTHLSGSSYITFTHEKFCHPRSELPKLIIRHNIGLISAANSTLLLLAQYWPYTKPIVIFTMASSSKNKRFT